MGGGEWYGPMPVGGQKYSGNFFTSVKIKVDGVNVPIQEKRRFEHTSGNSKKYWEIWKTKTDDNIHAFTTHWGRIGTKGQSKLKAFTYPSQRNEAYDKVINQKLKKGYVEMIVDGGSAGIKPVVKVITKENQKQYISGGLPPKSKGKPKITMPKVGKPKPADHDNIVIKEENEDPFLDRLGNIELE